jgi:hypothetical protein
MTVTFELQPEIYGTVQPEPETLTVVLVQMVEAQNNHLNST